MPDAALGSGLERGWFNDAEPKCWELQMSEVSFPDASSWMCISVFLEAAQCECKKQVRQEQNFLKYNLYWNSRQFQGCHFRLRWPNAAQTLCKISLLTFTSRSVMLKVTFFSWPLRLAVPRSVAWVSAGESPSLTLGRRDFPSLSVLTRSRLSPAINTRIIHVLKFFAWISYWLEYLARVHTGSLQGLVF